MALAGTVNVDGLIVSGDRALARSGGVEWVDPFVGARIRFQPARGEEIVVRGDVGGFGAASKFTWQALATYNWQICTQAPMLIAGYACWRALSVDYAQGTGVERYEFDVCCSRARSWASPGGSRAQRLSSSFTLAASCGSEKGLGRNENSSSPSEALKASLG